MPFLSSVRKQFGPQGRKNTPWRAYAFSSHTFTNAGVTGATGPNLSQLQSAYSSQTWAQNTSYFSVPRQGIQQWTIPTAGYYRFTVAGAKGGSANINDQNGGAIVRGDVFLPVNTVLHMLVGQMGQDAGCSSGGGGGTFVAIQNAGGSSTSWSATVLPLFVAGGGSGQRNDTSYGEIARPGLLQTNGGNSNNGWGSTSGGTFGNGSTSALGSGAGGGFYSNGANGSNYGYGGYSFLNGGESRQNPTARQLGGFGGASTSTCEVCNNGAHSGAGGGYSGGAGGSQSSGCYGTAGSGGSFIISTATNVATSTGSWTRSNSSETTALASGSYGNIGSYNSGHGYITVQKL